MISIKRFAASPVVGPGEQVAWGVRRGLEQAPLSHWTLPTLQPGARTSRTFCYSGAKVTFPVLLVPRTGLGEAALGLQSDGGGGGDSIAGRANPISSRPTPGCWHRGQNLALADSWAGIGSGAWNAVSRPACGRAPLMDLATAREGQGERPGGAYERASCAGVIPGASKKCCPLQG